MVRQYEAEYKEYVCRLVVEEGRTMAELGRELEIASTTIGGWVKAYKKKTGWYDRHQAIQSKVAQDQAAKTFKTPSDYEKDLTDQAKRIQRLEEENAILKKAMHVFTRARE